MATNISMDMGESVNWISIKPFVINYELTLLPSFNS